MPARTNDFQQLIHILVMTLNAGAPATVTESAILTDTATGGDREVDILVETEISGFPTSLAFECVARSRPADVTWVEQMDAKHSRLPTDKLVLVSASGFTKDALILAKNKNHRAVTPGEVTPDFVGDIVNNLQSVWVKAFNFTPRHVNFALDNSAVPAGSGEYAPVDQMFYKPDGTVVCDGADFVAHRVAQVDMSSAAVRDATGREKAFKLEEDRPSCGGGQPLCVLVEHDGERAFVPILKLTITGQVDPSVVEMPLKHGQFDSASYAIGDANVGTDRMRYVIVEREGMERLTTVRFDPLE